MKYQNPVYRILVALWWLLLAPAAHSQLRIEIIGGGANQVPIAIAPFKAESALPQKVTDVIAADLYRSGLFKIVDSGGLTAIPSEPAEVQYPAWNARGAEVLVIGSVSTLSSGYWDVRFRLMDVLKQTQLTGFAYQVTAPQLRNTAHKIADAMPRRIASCVRPDGSSRGCGNTRRRRRRRPA